MSVTPNPSTLDDQVTLGVTQMKVAQGWEDLGSPVQPQTHASNIGAVTDPSILNVLQVPQGSMAVSDGNPVHDSLNRKEAKPLAGAQIGGDGQGQFLVGYALAAGQADTCPENMTGPITRVISGGGPVAGNGTGGKSVC